ncbi:hypothetical protein HYFRA_00008426 [Hymenoscyphus fraxineus]|uniref:Uncharacterized protein n=1 Tax=Hymenoscyphus fraxineus TaxID=746836 RepID=A0A9N9KM04_9HELO|nr:hypothetical protein HYFRA_00008426 [Hymenoscyphus fraxineus]
MVMVLWCGRFNKAKQGRGAQVGAGAWVQASTAIVSRVLGESEMEVVQKETLEKMAAARRPVKKSSKGNGRREVQRGQSAYGESGWGETETQTHRLERAERARVQVEQVRGAEFLPHAGRLRCPSSSPGAPAVKQQLSCSAKTRTPPQPGPGLRVGAESSSDMCRGCMNLQYQITCLSLSCASVAVRRLR